MRRVIAFNTSFLSYLCIISSAAFYAASFLTDLCWGVSFICFIPLFIQHFSSYRSALGAGFLWGLIAYGLTLSALLKVIVQLGEKPISYVYALGFLGYFVFFSMLWCALALFLKRITKSWAAGWFLSSFLYFSWIQTGFFYFLTGYLYGYPLACPLLPLIKVPAFLGLLPLLGWYGLLFALLCMQVGVSQKKLVLIFVGSIPFVLSFFIFNQTKVCEEQDKKIIMVSHMFYKKTPYERAQELYDLLYEMKRLHPYAQMFVLPESAFPFPLNIDQYAQELLTQACGDTYLVLGSHYYCVDSKKKGCLYNSAYVLHQGRILYRYDKKLLLPFFEEQPKQSFFLQKTIAPFLVGKSAFNSRVEEQESCNLPGLGTFSFRICSELLWDIPVGQQVLVLVNDSHYDYPYFPPLFRLFAQFQSLEKRSTLFYCGWKQKGYFSFMAFYK